MAVKILTTIITVTTVTVYTISYGSLTVSAEGKKKSLRVVH